MPAAETLFSPWDPTAFLRVSGPDAAAFLQGQFSNDLRPAALGRAVYGLWLNARGRVLADGHVLARGDGLFDVVSAWCDASTLRQRLEANLVADEVAIEDHTVATAGWVFAGPGAAAWLHQAGFSSPSPGTFATFEDCLLLPARLSGEPNWHLFAPASRRAEWERRLTAQVAPEASRWLRAADRAELARRRILSGLPAVPAELGPADLAAEGGLEEEAISFTKGCYVGQEVVARLRHLGQVRRRLFVLRGHDGDVAGPLPAPLFSEGKRIGELRSCLADPQGRWVGMAMLNVAAAGPGSKVSRHEQGGPFAELLYRAEGRAW